jgi:hypothetical protein
MGLQETGREDVDWVQVVQGTNQWQAFVIAIMNRRMPNKAGVVKLR